MPVFLYGNNTPHHPPASTSSPWSVFCITMIRLRHHDMGTYWNITPFICRGNHLVSLQVRPGMFGMFGIPGMPMPLGRAPFMPMGQPPGIPENLQGKELEVLIFKNNTGGWRGWLLVFWRVRFRNLVIRLCKRINPVPLTAVSYWFSICASSHPFPKGGFNQSCVETTKTGISRFHQKMAAPGPTVKCTHQPIQTHPKRKIIWKRKIAIRK